MMHEGTHLLQGNDDKALLFRTVKEQQPPLGDLLEWFKDNKANLPQKDLVQELLDNTDNIDYEDLAGATTATLRKGFIVSAKKNADPTTARYLEHLTGQTSCRGRMGYPQDGRRYIQIHCFQTSLWQYSPAEVISAYEQGLFDDMSPYDGTLSEEYADQIGLKSMNDLRGVERAVIADGDLAGSYLVFPDRTWPDHMQLVIMRPDLELYKHDQNSDTLDPLLFEALNALFYVPVEVVRGATFDAF